MTTPTPGGRDAHVKELSGKLLTMKFMQRSHQAEVRAKLEQDQQKTISESHWVIYSDTVDRESSVATKRFEIDQSYMSFTDTPLVGRKSFKNFNKDIESLAQSQELQQRLNKSEKVDARESLSDKELAGRYKSLSTVGGQVESGKPKTKGKKRKSVGGEGVPGIPAGGTNDTEGDEHGSSQRFKFLKPSVDE
ncbi:hypothetical protein BDR26DRAFT_862278 [Obelidium mucronatum]|nr:hypothetical protein BDR26DRAFT_862278 [Obelidium mucronatum]